MGNHVNVIYSVLVGETLTIYLLDCEEVGHITHYNKGQQQLYVHIPSMRLIYSDKYPSNYKVMIYASVTCW